MDESDSPPLSRPPRDGARWNAFIKMLAGQAVAITVTVLLGTNTTLLGQLAPVSILILTLWWTAQGQAGHHAAVARGPRWHRWSAWLIALLLVGAYVVLTAVRVAEGSAWVTFLTVACLVAASTSGLHAVLSPRPSTPGTVIGLAVVLGGAAMLLAGARLLRNGQPLVGGGLLMTSLAFLVLAVAVALVLAPATRPSGRSVADVPWLKLAACAAIAVAGALSLFGAEAYKVDREALAAGMWWVAFQCLVIGAAWATRNRTFIDLALISGGRNLGGPLGWGLVWFDVISHEGWSVALPGVILSVGSVFFIYFVVYKLLTQAPDGTSEATGGEPLPETQDNSAADGFWLGMMTISVGPLILPPVAVALFVIVVAPGREPLVSVALWLAVLGALIAVILRASRAVTERSWGSRAIRFLSELPPPVDPEGPTPPASPSTDEGAR